jgi:hypothetical protein
MKQWRKSSRFRKLYKKVMESKCSRNAVRLYRLEYNRPVFKKHRYDFAGYSNISIYAMNKAISKWFNDRPYYTIRNTCPENMGSTIRKVESI